MARTPAAPTISRTNICKRRRFFHPMKQNAAANSDPGMNGPGACWNAVVDVFEIVRVVEAGLPNGVTFGGAKVQVVPAGSPEHANVTLELNPFCGATEIVVVPFVPDATVSEVGDAEIEKSALDVMLIVYVAEATALVE